MGNSLDSLADAVCKSSDACIRQSGKPSEWPERDKRYPARDTRASKVAVPLTAQVCAAMAGDARAVV